MPSVGDLVNNVGDLVIVWTSQIIYSACDFVTSVGELVNSVLVI